MRVFIFCIFLSLILSNSVDASYTGSWKITGVYSEKPTDCSYQGPGEGGAYQDVDCQIVQNSDHILLVENGVEHIYKKIDKHTFKLQTHNHLIEFIDGNYALIYLGCDRGILHLRKNDVDLKPQLPFGNFSGLWYLNGSYHESCYNEKIGKYDNKLYAFYNTIQGLQEIAENGKLTSWIKTGTNTFEIPDRGFKLIFEGIDSGKLILDCNRGILYLSRRKTNHN